MGSAEFDRRCRTGSTSRRAGLWSGRRPAANAARIPCWRCLHHLFPREMGERLLPDRTEKGAFHLPTALPSNATSCTRSGRTITTGRTASRRCRSVWRTVAACGSYLPDRASPWTSCYPMTRPWLSCAKKGTGRTGSNLIVNMAEPKFDVSSDLDLEKGRGRWARRRVRPRRLRFQPRDRGDGRDRALRREARRPRRRRRGGRDRPRVHGEDGRREPP